MRTHEFVAASIVIPTYRRHDLLLRCLRAVCSQQLEHDCFEVIVADDAACPETEAVVADFLNKHRSLIARSHVHEVRYVPVGPAHGPAAARNCGWREARGELIAFTDDDCVPDRMWLATAVKHFARHPDTSAAWGSLQMPLPDRPTDYERDAAGLASAVFVTANCFVRQSALVEVGGFDERFRVAWREDSDLYFSLLESGNKVEHLAGALVVHPIRPAPWGISLKQQFKSRYDMLLYRKHPVLYRRHVPAFPSLYIAIVGFMIAAITLLVAGRSQLALLCAMASLAMTLTFTVRRLRGTSHRIEHVTEMLFTSLLIPWLSVYHRLIGLWLFSTAFTPMIMPLRYLRVLWSSPILCILKTGASMRRSA